MRCNEDLIKIVINENSPAPNFIAIANLMSLQTNIFYS